MHTEERPRIILQKHEHIFWLEPAKLMEIKLIQESQINTFANMKKTQSSLIYHRHVVVTEGGAFCSKLKYLNNYLRDWYEILYRYT